MSAGERMKLPAWLLEQPAQAPAGHAGSHRFLLKTVRALRGVVSDDLMCERYATKPLLLQGVDPRVKLMVFLAYTVFSAFSSNIAVLAVCAGTALLYAGLSGLDVPVYFRRVWAYLPVLIFCISFLGDSSLFREGRPLFYLLPAGLPGLHEGLYLTAGGLAAAVCLAMRAGVSLSFTFLLLLTTRWSRITGALAALHLPHLFVSVLDMAYRYLFALVELAGGMMDARALRTVGRLSPAENRRFMGRSLAWLFVRSHLWSEEVYDAMLCRGYTGRPVRMTSLRAQEADRLFIVSNALILLLLTAGECLL